MTQITSDALNIQHLSPLSLKEQIKYVKRVPEGNRKKFMKEADMGAVYEGETKKGLRKADALKEVFDEMIN